MDVLLSPYRGEDNSADRIVLSLPEVHVGETSATSIVLIVHELATNSVKYGAFSKPEGLLNVSCSIKDDTVTMIWLERGGPPVSAPAGPGGFGSKLIERSVSGQLGGSIVFDWPASGAVVTIRMNQERLAR